MFNWCWHNWSSWSEPTDVYDSNMKNQFAVCSKCNAYKHRKFGHNIGVSARTIVDLVKGKSNGN